MLAYHRKSVCLSIISTDLPIWSVVETAATLYQKDGERFHLLFTEPLTHQHQPQQPSTRQNPRLLWLEISPYRVTMTLQANGQLNYRHFWEQGVYGVSRYWLHSEPLQDQQIHLHNFTRHLSLTGRLLPQQLRVEYELWSEKVQLGRYILNLEIHH